MSSAPAHSGLSKCEAWESVQGLWKPRGDPFCVTGFVPRVSLCFLVRRLLSPPLPSSG